MSGKPARSLSVVPSKRPVARRSSVTAAAKKSRRDLLAALRDRIASDIAQGVPARDLASLSKRLLDISRELDELEAVEDGDDISAAAATPDEPWTGSAEVPDPS